MFVRDVDLPKEKTVPSSLIVVMTVTTSHVVCSVLCVVVDVDVVV